MTVRRQYLPTAQLFQPFLAGPDGLTIEIDFPGLPAEPAQLP